MGFFSAYVCTCKDPKRNTVILFLKFKKVQCKGKYVVIMQLNQQSLKCKSNFASQILRLIQPLILEYSVNRMGFSYLQFSFPLPSLLKYFFYLKIRQLTCLSNSKCLINDYTRIYLELPQNSLSELQVISASLSSFLKHFPFISCLYHISGDVYL